MLSKLEAITIVIQEQGSMLTTIMSHLDTRSIEAEKDFHFEFVSGLFPIKQIDELNDLEKMLGQDAAKNKLVNFSFQSQ